MTKLKLSKSLKRWNFFVRGDIYRLPANPNAKGHQQRGARYGVVVQSDFLPLSTILIAPTSTRASTQSFRPEIEIQGVATRICVEQTVAINAERLGQFAGRLNANELEELDAALRSVFALY
jgi:mRNA interferase MazF